MAGVKFTPSQQKAIDESGKNIIVSAGAGSGKTAVLSERVLHFVRDEGYKLDEFLILTFTNLAAKEMKDRIRKKLTKAGLEESKNVDTADICTFDSYAFSIVKKYHFLLGLSEDVSIVDSNVISVKKREFLNNLFESKYGSNDESFKNLIKRFSFKDDKDVINCVLELHNEASLSNDTMEYLNQFETKMLSNENRQMIIDMIKTKLEAQRDNLIDLINNLPYDPCSKKDNTPYQTKVRSLLDGYLYADTIQGMVSNLLSYKAPVFKAELDDESKENKSKFMNYLGVIKKYINTNNIVSEEDIAKKIEENSIYVKTIVELAIALEEYQMSYKKEKQVFEFSDIAKLALKLVRGSTEVKNSIKNKLRMIMIDEYQDTSTLQEDFINEIASDNVYMVGDIKQSIYRFRNASSEIFQNKYDKYKSKKGGMAIDLNMNFRSRGEVLEDINIMFSDIMTSSIGGANYKKDHIIEYGNKDYLKAGDNKDSNHSLFLLYNDVESSKKANLEARIIAEDIIHKVNTGYLVYQQRDEGSIVRPCRFSDFCILMDRGSAFDEYRRVFTNSHIPLNVEADEDISSNQIVLILSNLLIIVKAIKQNDYSSSDFVHSYLSLARSFVYQYSDEELYRIAKNNEYSNTDLIKEIKEIIYENQSLPNYELFKKLIFDLEIYNKLNRIGNVRKNEIYLDVFLNYFKQMSDLDYSLDDFITYLKNINDYSLKIVLSSQGNSVESVKMMNIHKSKGLEFPIVYFAGLTKSFNASYKKISLGVSKPYGLILPLQTGEGVNPIKIANTIYETNEDLSEKIRLFYVALTRTREKMIFVLPEAEEEVALNESTSFYDFVSRFVQNSKFERKKIDENFIIEMLKEEEDKVAREKFVIKELNVKSNIVEASHASKELSLSASKKALMLGTELHLILETMNFKQPDYSIIKEEKCKEIVKSFLDCEILKNIQKGDIYKEYEFYDDKNLIGGIIDLMIIYDDRIDIIDYKTKSIEDSNYDKQLKVYGAYIEEHFNKPVDLYLYSLFDKTYRKIK